MSFDSLLVELRSSTPLLIELRSSLLVFITAGHCSIITTRVFCKILVFGIILQGSASIMLRSDSTKVSSPHKRDDAEIVFLKDNVAIHPTQFASERISGRLKLFKQGTSLFMTWVPYKGHRSEASLSEKERSLYTIRAVPFTDIRSIQRHSPALGWQYIIVVLSSGFSHQWRLAFTLRLAYPPLYFYSG
ncbi:TBC1 domain family member [Arachis hypogaea]|nr:TBC1 domain family member [Arachis hypogaea]